MAVRSFVGLLVTGFRVGSLVGLSVNGVWLGLSVVGFGVGLLATGLGVGRLVGLLMVIAGLGVRWLGRVSITGI